MDKGTCELKNCENELGEDEEHTLEFQIEKIEFDEILGVDKVSGIETRRIKVCPFHHSLVSMNAPSMFSIADVDGEAKLEADPIVPETLL